MNFVRFFYCIDITYDLRTLRLTTHTQNVNLFNKWFRQIVNSFCQRKKENNNNNNTIEKKKPAKRFEREQITMQTLHGMNWALTVLTPIHMRMIWNGPKLPKRLNGWWKWIVFDWDSIWSNGIMIQIPAIVVNRMTLVMRKKEKETSIRSGCNDFLFREPISVTSSVIATSLGSWAWLLFRC